MLTVTPQVEAHRRFLGQVVHAVSVYNFLLKNVMIWEIEPDFIGMKHILEANHVKLICDGFETPEDIFQTEFVSGIT